MIRKTLGAAVVTAALLVASSATAQVPRIINFQGHLRDAATGSAKTGAFSITFSIWKTSTSTGLSCSQDSTNCCFSETQPVPVNSGLFNVNIGERSSGGISTACNFSAPYYIEVQITGDAAMTPRPPLTSVAYAIRSAIATNSSTFGGSTPAQLFNRTTYSVNTNCVPAGGLSCQPECTTAVYGPWRYNGCFNGDTTYYNPPACPSGCTELGNPSTFCDSISLSDSGGTKYRYKKTCKCPNTQFGTLMTP